MQSSKIKVLPEDFVVHEKIDLPLTESGSHRVYVMEKRSWNTVDAVESIAQASGVSSSMIRYAGLKDRHALTYQHISAPSGIRLVSANSSVRLSFLGFSDDFVSTRVLVGNKFRVTLRSLSGTEQDAVSARVPEAASFGFPNYYDDQRFGSVTEDGFFAERLLRGHLRGALRLHLTAQFPGDSPSERERKERMAFAWGKWDEVRNRCVTPDEIAVAEALRRGGRRNDLLLGINAIPASQLAMYLSAYQSYLWNRVLRVVLASHLNEPAFVKLREAYDGTLMHPSAPTTREIAFKREPGERSMKRPFAMASRQATSTTPRESGDRSLAHQSATASSQVAFDAPGESGDPSLMRQSTTISSPTFTAFGKLGDYAFYRGMSAEALRCLSSLQIPTVARRVLPCEPEVQEAIDKVLTKIDIPLSAFGLRGIRNAYFHSFYRPAIVVPKDLAVSPVSPDERYPGRGKMCLEFRLPAGAYATMLVKALVGLAKP